MRQIDVGPDEMARRELGGVKKAEAIGSLLEDGYVILTNAVDLDHVKALNARMQADVAAILARKDAPFNFNTGNIQQDPPPFPPYLFRDVLTNDFVISITRAVLGAGVKSTFYSGNTALPGQDVRQPVHADSGQLWPHLDVATPPYTLVVNVPTVDVSPHNGSIELWPGTHTDTTVYVQSGDIKVPPEHVEARRRVCPPFQPVMPAGSVLIRDMRLWHAGMPNYSDAPRPMIAMIHCVSWWNEGRPMVFQKGAEPVLHHPELRSVAEFVDGPIDYLGRHKAYDFDR